MLEFVLLEKTLLELRSRESNGGRETEVSKIGSGVKRSEGSILLIRELEVIK